MRKGTKFKIVKYGQVWTLTSLKKDGLGCCAYAPLKYPDGSIHMERMWISIYDIKPMSFVGICESMN